MRNKIIAAGYLCLDITPGFPDSSMGRKLQDLVRPGKLRKIRKAALSPGGCVTNTGLALYKLGADVSLVGKVGDDDFGHILQDHYRQMGADPDFIISKDVETAYTIVLAVPGNDRCFLADTGANDAFYAEDLDYEAVSRAQYFHFGYPALMRSCFEDGGVMLSKMLSRVKDEGLIVSMDTAMPDAGSEDSHVDWEQILKRALPYVDIFMPSIEELCFMLDRERYEAWQERASASGRDICMERSLSEDVKPLAKKALEMGCGAVLLKCGAAGIYFCSSSEEHMRSIAGRYMENVKRCEAAEAADTDSGNGKREGEGFFTGEGWGDCDIFQDSYLPDRILSGTGAGDTAIAGFLYAMSRGKTPQQCLKIAAGCGSMCITQYDTLSGLIPIPDLEKRIADGWETQHFIRG